MGRCWVSGLFWCCNGLRAFQIKGPYQVAKGSALETWALVCVCLLVGVSGPLAGVYASHFQSEG